MLDVFRAIAVLLVIKVHWLYFDLNLLGRFKDYFLKYQNIENYILYSNRFVHPGVLMFIVLSGFIIHFTNKVAPEQASLKWSGKFILRRFARLYPIFMLGLILGFLVQHFFYAELTSLDLDKFWQNSLFIYGLQYIQQPVINNILVTVESEFWLYVLYAIVFRFLTNKTRWTIFLMICFSVWVYNIQENIATTASIGTLIYWNQHNLIAFLLYWFMGAFAAEVAKKIDVNKLSWLAPLSVILFVVATIPHQPKHVTWYMFNECMMAFAWALLLIKLSRITANNFMIRGFAKIGQAGYSIYATHMCLFMFFTSSYMSTHYADFLHPTYVLIYTLLIAFNIYYLVERPLHLKTKKLFNNW